MAWKIEFLESAKKQLKKIDRHWRAIILDYLEKDISILENPRIKGNALLGDKQGLWRYRVNDYRIICEIQDSKTLIIVALIGHRKNVYD